MMTIKQQEKLSTLNIHDVIDTGVKISLISLWEIAANSCNTPAIRLQAADSILNYVSQKI